MLKIKMNLIKIKGQKQYGVVQLFDFGIQVATLLLIERENSYEIDDFSVFQTYRRKGYGTKLIKFVLQFAKKDLYLSVYKTNSIACKFYERIGFKIEHNCDQLYEATLKFGEIK